MPKSVKAIVKPELLVWARESARLSVDDVATKLKLPKERIEAWESGEDACTVPQLRKLAESYKRPLAVFYLPRPPKDFDALRDFRRLPTQLDYEESPAMASEIRWAHQIREVDKIEVFCNRVAGETLVPGGDLRRTEIIRGHHQGEDWTDQELDELSNRYNVSEEAG